MSYLSNHAFTILILGPLFFFEKTIDLDSLSLRFISSICCHRLRFSLHHFFRPQWAKSFHCYFCCFFSNNGIVLLFLTLPYRSPWRFAASSPRPWHSTRFWKGHLHLHFLYWFFSSFFEFLIFSSFVFINYLICAFKSPIYRLCERYFSFFWNFCFTAFYWDSYLHFLLFCARNLERNTYSSKEQMHMCKDLIFGKSKFSFIDYFGRWVFCFL